MIFTVLSLPTLCAASEDVFQGDLGLGLVLLLGSDCTVEAWFCCSIMRLVMLFDLQFWVSLFFSLLVVTVSATIRCYDLRRSDHGTIMLLGRCFARRHSHKPILVVVGDGYHEGGGG